jgi:hypothetical protein
MYLIIKDMLYWSLQGPVGTGGFWGQIRNPMKGQNEKGTDNPYCIGLGGSHQASTPENQHPVNVLQGFAPDNQQRLH